MRLPLDRLASVPIQRPIDARPQRRANQRACWEVQKAIARGDLRPPTDFACDDCGRPAEMYDHRDYSKPLEVRPVCRGCNVVRGPAAFEGGSNA